MGMGVNKDAPKQRRDRENCNQPEVEKLFPARNRRVRLVCRGRPCRDKAPEDRADQYRERDSKENWLLDHGHRDRVPEGRGQFAKISGNEYDDFPREDLVGLPDRRCPRELLGEDLVVEQPWIQR